jgi:DNA transposition AAA+ family ATPase
MPRTVHGNSRNADGRLPPNQPLIQTVSVKRLFLFLDAACLSEQETGYTSMGVVIGGAGIGKTVAVVDYMARLQPLAHTGLPAGLLLKVGPRSSPPGVAKSIVVHLQERPRGRNTTVLANDLKIIIFDECNRMNEETFDVLRHIHDQTGCPIILVGLPNLLKVIRSQEQFDSRIGNRMVFRPPTRKEVLTTVLPQLVIPQWHYNPENPDELAMGEYLVRRVGLSWRKLRLAIQNASQFALRKQEERITLNILREATKSVGAKRESQEQEDEVLSDEQSGEHEAASARRHQGKAQAAPREQTQA